MAVNPKPRPNPAPLLKPELGCHVDGCSHRQAAPRAPAEPTVHALHQHKSTGRPIGSDRFLKRLEKLLGCLVRPQQAAREPKASEQ